MILPNSIEALEPAQDHHPGPAEVDDGSGPLHTGEANSEPIAGPALRRLVPHPQQP